MKYRLQFLPNFTLFVRCAPVTFANLLKGPKYVTFGAVAKGIQLPFISICMR
jgi:hypothetical protein